MTSAQLLDSHRRLAAKCPRRELAQRARPMAAWLGGPHASVWALGLSNTGFTCAIWCDRGVVAHNLRLEGHHAHISAVRRILRGREDEGENEIPTCLL